MEFKNFELKKESLKNELKQKREQQKKLKDEIKLLKLKNSINNDFEKLIKQQKNITDKIENLALYNPDDTELENLPAYLKILIIQDMYITQNTKINNLPVCLEKIIFITDSQDIKKIKDNEDYIFKLPFNCKLELYNLYDYYIEDKIIKENNLNDKNLYSMKELKDDTRKIFYYNCEIKESIFTGKINIQTLPRRIFNIRALLNNTDNYEY